MLDLQSTIHMVCCKLRSFQDGTACTRAAMQIIQRVPELTTADAEVVDALRAQLAEARGGNSSAMQQHSFNVKVIEHDHCLI